MVLCGYSKTGNFATWKFLVSQTDDKWWLWHFFTHVTTFHDHLTTLTAACDYTLTTWWLLVKTFWWPWQLVVKTFWWPVLWLMTIFWQPLMMTLTTHLTTWRPSTNNYCQTARASDKKYDSVTTMMTDDPNWWTNISSVTTHVTPPDDTWWPKWQQKNDPDDFGWQPHTTYVTTCWRPSKISWRHLTTPSGDIYRQSRKLPDLLGSFFAVDHLDQ